MTSWHILKKLHRQNVELTQINNCTKFYLFCINNDKVTVCVCVWGGGGGWGGGSALHPQFDSAQKKPRQKRVKKNTFNSNFYLMYIVKLYLYDLRSVFGTK